MCVCACACVCVCQCVCVCVCVCVCACACQCASGSLFHTVFSFAPASSQAETIAAEMMSEGSIEVSMGVCVCVCVTKHCFVCTHTRPLTHSLTHAHVSIYHPGDH